MKLNKIFSIKKEQEHIHIRVFGIKIKFKFFTYFYPGEDWLAPNTLKDIAQINKEKYNKLIKNLDDNSINIINTVIQRSKEFKDKNITHFNLTKDEKTEHKNLKSNFYAKIIQNENYFSFENYKIKGGNLEAGIFYHKLYIDDLKTKEKILNKSIIDAGAHIGDSAIILSKYTNDKVYAFEPVSTIYNILQENIKLNNIKNVVAVKNGLGSENIISEINLADMGSTLRETPQHNKELSKQEKIKIIKLDDYVNEHNLEVGLIKVDIEGFEQEFLKGAENVIKTQKPTLILSIYHNSDDFFNIKPLIESWNLGYKFRIKKPLNYTISLDTNLIAEIE